MREVSYIPEDPSEATISQIQGEQMDALEFLWMLWDIGAEVNPDLHEVIEDLDAMLVSSEYFEGL